MQYKPKKSLGQNFLVDRNIRDKIVNCLGLNGSSIVFEIGAGRGEMTSLLSLKAGEVCALELDSSLCGILEDKFRDCGNVKLIGSDILKFNISRYFSRRKNKITVVGNIPYYISSPIIEHLVKFRKKIGSVFITVQKEFAQRVVALPGSKDYGSFSCFVQYFFQPRIVFGISRNSFFPAPNVDSCFLELKPRESPPVKVKNRALLFKIIRAGFNQRRKTLRNSLKGVILPQKLEKALCELGHDANARAESLSLHDFAFLSNLK